MLVDVIPLQLPIGVLEEVLKKDAQEKMDSLKIVLIVLTVIMKAVREKVIIFLCAI